MTTNVSVTAACKRRRMRRRVLPFLTVLGLGLSTAGAARATTEPDGSAEPIVLTYGTVPGSSSTAIMVFGESQGYFTEEGLSVEILPVTSGVVAAFQAGDVDFIGVSLPAVIDTHVKGGDIRVVGALYPRIPHLLVVPPDSDIPVSGQDGATWEDTVGALRGRSIGSTGPGGGLDAVLRGLFEAAGFSGDDFTHVNTGLGGGAIGALTTGQVDAIYVGVEAATIALDTEVGVVALRPGEDGPPLIVDQASTAWVMRNAYLDENPGLAERFQRAMERTVDAAKDPANREALASALFEVEAVASVEDGVSLAETLPDVWGSTFTAESMDVAMEFTRSIGQLPEGSDLTVEDFVDPGALEG